MTATNKPEDAQVVVVGSANQDLTSYTSTVPVLGQTVMGQTFDTSCGGKGANQAVAAACLGMVPVRMVCRVADDVFGTELLENFSTIWNFAWYGCIANLREQSDINLHYCFSFIFGFFITGNTGVMYDESSTILSSRETSSGVAAITVDTKSGDNMIIVTPGANFVLSATDVRQELEKQKSTPPKVVLVQLEIKPEAALEALKVGKELGATTILNTAPAPEDFSIDDWYPHIDILIPNETELQELCKDAGVATDDEEAMAKYLIAKGVGKVLVTLGARGAMIVEESEAPGADIKVTMISAPDDLPCKNDKVEDTIGAGDAFCGALSTYLSAGLSLTDAATKACGVASMSVRKRGAQDSYPRGDALPDCLKLPAAVSSWESVAISRDHTASSRVHRRWHSDYIKVQFIWLSKNLRTLMMYTNIWEYRIEQKT